DILAKPKESIDELLDFSHDTGCIKKEAYDHARENITYDTNLEKAAKDSDLVVGAVLEKMDLKIDVFKQLDGICHADTILATNTSTMSPTEIGAQSSRPDKVLAMHFFNPVHKMKLIE